MAVDHELMTFVKDALGRGIARVEVEQVLRRAGWSAEQVAGGMAAFADLDFAVPVPRPRPYVSAREAFMYVVMFTTLYISAWSLGSLVFEFIDRAFPDPAMRRGVESSLAAIRWSVASIVVAFPVFLYVGTLVARSIRRDPTKRASKIRRNLTYVTLFVASCMLLGDVTTLIYNLLGGELTVRFVLKALTIGLIAGAAFVYYLTGLRHDEKEVPQ